MAHEIHPMFLTENCIPIVVWNMADGDERYVAHCLNSVNQLGMPLSLSSPPRPLPFPLPLSFSPSPSPLLPLSSQ